MGHGAFSQGSQGHPAVALGCGGIWEVPDPGDGPRRTGCAGGCVVGCGSGGLLARFPAPLKARPLRA
ncbi:hypothetical protein SBD_5141 [Streptomyces bottropensis ATCC 25435]|uniref:Uncharacterized protein n=1 Tax=Streptomyces bottropensis ATCC 25435 TaxID=1054862 RepID=M3EBP4_9ACTN|nr:hypothetical protein SBD_5141 [Streptomyces bottropensis ATCC 25435]